MAVLAQGITLDLFLAVRPQDVDPRLEVDFTPLREQDPAAAGFSTAA